MENLLEVVELEGKIEKKLGFPLESYLAGMINSEGFSRDKMMMIEQAVLARACRSIWGRLAFNYESFSEEFRKKTDDGSYRLYVNITYDKMLKHAKIAKSLLDAEENL